MGEHVWREAATDDERARASEIVAAVAETLMSTADPEWGGWGARQKFPHPDALHFLLVLGADTGAPRPLEVALQTLRSMARAEIHDRVEGGFYRYATRPDWSVPDHEKPLLSNAKRLLAYAEAHQVHGDPAFRDIALGTAAWLRGTLLDPATGAFRATQDADPVYARLGTLEERRSRGAPPVDPTIHADRNAWAVIAMLKAGFVLREGSLVESGLGALRFVLDAMFDRARGVFHYWNGSPNQPGELLDQATVLRAIVEAAHSGGTNEHLGAGLDIAEWADARLSSEDGSFRSDPFQDPTPAASRGAEDLGANALMAEGLIRLGMLTGQGRWLARGREALMAFADAWRPHGFATAGFGRALHLIAREPVHVVVVGAPGDERTAALYDAARRTYVASRVAQAVDPEREPDLRHALGLEGADAAPGEPFAALRAPGRSDVLVTTDPGRLAEALSKASSLDQD